MTSVTPADTSQTAETRPAEQSRHTRSWRIFARRLAIAPVILLGVAFLVFVVVDRSPNDPARARLGTLADAEARAQFAEQHGLNDPLPIRFVRFLGDLSQFRLGDSVVRPESVDQLVRYALPVTLELMVLITCLTVILSFLLGVVAAAHADRATDTVITTSAAAFQAMPPFWIGLVFIQVFAVQMGWLPSGGYVPFQEDPGAWFRSIIGPTTVMVLPLTAVMTRVVRAAMIDELGKDYVRTARGAGIPMFVVLARNTLRNALITPITVMGVIIGSLMSGSILVEVVFDLPGMGTLLMSGVRTGDLAIVRGVAIIGAIGFVVVNLLVDLLYLVLNPRSSDEVHG